MSGLVLFPVRVPLRDRSVKRCYGEEFAAFGMPRPGPQGARGGQRDSGGISFRLARHSGTIAEMTTRTTSRVADFSFPIHPKHLCVAPKLWIRAEFMRCPSSHRLDPTRYFVSTTSPLLQNGSSGQ